MCIPPIYGRSIKRRKSEESQTMKWVGIFQVRIFWVEIFRGGGNFPVGSLMGGNFPRRNFQRTFINTLKFHKISNI